MHGEHRGLTHQTTVLGGWDLQLGTFGVCKNNEGDRRSAGEAFFGTIRLVTFVWEPGRASSLGRSRRTVRHGNARHCIIDSWIHGEAQANRSIPIHIGHWIFERLVSWWSACRRKRREGLHWERDRMETEGKGREGAEEGGS